jgi:hypothetical protein
LWFIDKQARRPALLVQFDDVLRRQPVERHLHYTDCALDDPLSSGDDSPTSRR